MIPLNKKAGMLTSILLSAGLVFSGSAAAFDDVKGLPGEKKLLELKQRGLINGVTDHQFAPKSKLTAAQGVHLLVKAFDLSLAGFTFVKQPQASDSFDYVANDAWYAEDFVIAALNGVPIPRDIDPAAELTREQFAEWLIAAVDTKGNYAIPMIYMTIADEKDVTPEKMNAIQKLLITKIGKVDEDGRFRPKEAITRAEAAVWVHDAIRFVEERQQQPAKQYEVSVKTEAVTKDVNKVVLSADLPNPGYGLRIESVRFTGDNVAVIGYRAIEPDPDKMYPQVITKAEAVTYVDARYKLETVQLN